MIPVFHYLQDYIGRKPVLHVKYLECILARRHDAQPLSCRRPHIPLMITPNAEHDVIAQPTAFVGKMHVLAGASVQYIDTICRADP